MPQQTSGTGLQLAQYLIGLGCLIIGATLLLLGVHDKAVAALLVGLAVFLFGLRLIVLKIVRRNRRP